MQENIYQKLVRLIEDNHLTIKTKETYDPQSGWTGKYYWVCDGDYCITDLSGNGYCFDDFNVQKGIKKIEEYLAFKNLSTIEHLKRWIDEHTEEDNR